MGRSFTLGQDPDISAEANAAVLAIFNDANIAEPDPPAPPAGDPPVDDDPYCACGVARSEHQLLGCPEGFQTPASWAAEKAAIEDEIRHRDDYGPEPDPPAGTCFCGDPLNQNTWCGCTEGLRRLSAHAERQADDCDQGRDEVGPERQWSREARFDDQDFDCSDADLGQLACTQEWQAHQNAIGRIFDTQ